MTAAELCSMQRMEREFVEYCVPAGPGFEIELLPWLRHLPNRSVTRMLEIRDEWNSFLNKFMDKRKVGKMLKDLALRLFEQTIIYCGMPDPPCLRILTHVVLV